jgi:hypothetical protein
MGALRAVIGGHADVAPLDSYALALMRRHAPDLVARVRVVASTEPTAIPAFVASGTASPAIVEAFLAADDRALLEPLLLSRFEAPDQAGYDALRHRFETMRAFWLSHPLAETIHPACLPLPAQAGDRLAQAMFQGMEMAPDVEQHRRRALVRQAGRLPGERAVAPRAAIVARIGGQAGVGGEAQPVLACPGELAAAGLDQAAARIEAGRDGQAMTGSGQAAGEEGVHGQSRK